MPVFKRIGLGAILGYLAAGVIVGASLSLGFTKNPDKLLHFAEFGVVLFLFVIGLEMKPAKLLEMRGDIFGIGLAQVVLCGGVLAVPPLALGMSYAMGAFIAGVMLADSSFRHELEANVEPFRGLFLGLFFMAVGVSLSIDAVVANWGTILIAVPVVIILKAAVIYGILRGFGTAHEVAVRAALALPQAGEFGFVLFASAVSAGILGAETSSILVAVITLTMVASPLVERLVPLLIADKAGDEIEEDFSDAGGRALVIGFGRFGQVVTQALRLRDISVTILDADAERVREAQEFGSRIHFGDGMRREVLRAAGAEDADVIVVCADDAAVAKDIVNMVQSKFPQAELLVRAYDRTAAIDLIHMGIEEPVRETFESGLRMGRAALRAAGVAEDDAAETIDDVRRRDESRLHLQV